MKPVVICLLGPTASGKSAAALALAAHLPVEIITLDSAQAFCDMDIGTAKPSAAERASVPHHLIDIVSPLEVYSAARFREDCIALMAQIQARGHVPLIVGGTMLYYKALREGLSSLPAADPALREEIRSRAQAIGWPALHAELARLDPETAARLAPLDSQRIERALEVVRLTGRPMAISFENTTAPLPVTLRPIALVPAERSGLHARIEQRFDAMLAAGLVDEVVALRERYDLHPALASMRCVGYRQAWEYLEGQYDRATLRDRGIFATRQLAKRQLTWLRSTPDLTVIDCLREDAPQAVCEAALRLVEGASPTPAAPFEW